MTDCTDCNVFQFCQFLKLLGKIMIILVLLIVGMTYYAVIIATAVPGLHEGGAGNVTWCLFVFVTFHFLVWALIKQVLQSEIPHRFPMSCAVLIYADHYASLELFHRSCN